jgi:hypothetical protein
MNQETNQLTKEIFLGNHRDQQNDVATSAQKKWLKRPGKTTGAIGVALFATDADRGHWGGVLSAGTDDLCHFF